LETHTVHVAAAADARHRCGGGEECRGSAPGSQIDRPAVDRSAAIDIHVVHVGGIDGIVVSARCWRTDSIVGVDLDGGERTGSSTIGARHGRSYFWGRGARMALLAESLLHDDDGHGDDGDKDDADDDHESDQMMGDEDDGDDESNLTMMTNLTR
jgi:hypothetical protein